jgi:hypothetical protein
MLGAGRLAAALWRMPNRLGGQFQFNIYRLDAATGRVSQRMALRDLADVLKLVQLLASLVAADGSVPTEQRRRLARLAAAIELISVPPE